MTKNLDDTNNEGINGSNMPGNGISPLLGLPFDVMQLILSFIPAPVTLCNVAVAASYFSCIARCEDYWRNVWAESVGACFRRYVQPPLSLHAALSASHGTYTLLIASVPKAALPRLDWIKAAGLVFTEEIGEKDDDNLSVMHIGLNVQPLRLDHAYEEGAVALTRCLWQHENSNEIGFLSCSENGDDTQRLRKALYFLHSGGTLGYDRPMVDSLKAVRLFVLSHRLPPPHRRDGTPLEQEAALVEFAGALLYAWGRCHPAHSSFPVTRVAVHIPWNHEETTSTSIFPPGDDNNNIGNNDGALAVVGTNDGVFFSVTTLLPSPSSSSTLLSPLSGARLWRENRRLRHSLPDTITYLYLLHHISFSDIHQHIWDDERRCAICSRVVSPTGRAVEFRFFISSLQSSYPRFFVKMFFVEGDLPRTRIQEVFDNENAFSAVATTSIGRNLEEEEEEEGDIKQRASPKLATLFYGGFGRVEVDIPPTVFRDHFVELREALGLGEGFPMPLLWNVVMFASGVGGVILHKQQSSFMAYYTTTFAASFEKIFP